MKTLVPANTHHAHRIKPSWSARAAAITLTAALFLSACGATPAEIPTATPYGPAPTAADVIATATTNAPGTATAEARSAKAAGEAGPTTAAASAASGDRM